MLVYINDCAVCLREINLPLFQNAGRKIPDIIMTMELHYLLHNVDILEQD